VQPELIEDALSHIVTLRGGARIVATWSEEIRGEPSPEAATVEARQVGAAAAMLAIPLMREDAAAKLAESEGIVCHLTSLVLVDEAGERHAGVPASRKVELSAPRTGLALASVSRACYAPLATDFIAREMGSMPVGAPAPSSSGILGSLSSRSRSESRRREAESSAPKASAPPPSSPRRGGGPLISLRGTANRIGWNNDPEALRRGDLSGLPGDVNAAIRTAAQGPEVIALAHALGLDPIVVVIALIARSCGWSNRSAQRLARQILGKPAADLIDAALEEVGLS
jgi:hypothetical protein